MSDRCLIVEKNYNVSDRYVIFGAISFEFKLKALQMNIRDLVEKVGYTPKSKSSTHGGEFSCPCPFCKEGNDRFLIWPQRNNSNGDYRGGRFYCRVCGKYGDGINFLREFHGMTYRNACANLNIEPKQGNCITFSRSKQKPEIVKGPSDLWKEKGQAFIEWSHAQLMKNQKALAEIMKRGFSVESIVKFKLGFNSGDFGKDFFRVRKTWGLPTALKEDGTEKKLWLPVGLSIPTFSENKGLIKVKIRRTSWKEGDKLPKYVEISGSKQCTSIYGDTSLPIALILESEFDALLIQQFASDVLFCAALGGCSKPIDFETDKLLRNTGTVLFLPDFDKSGANAWSRWKDLFPSIKRVLTPSEKSAGDFHISGGDLREWLLAALQDEKQE